MNTRTRVVSATASSNGYFFAKAFDDNLTPDECEAQQVTWAANAIISNIITKANLAERPHTEITLQILAKHCERYPASLMTSLEQLNFSSDCMLAIVIPPRSEHGHHETIQSVSKHYHFHKWLVATLPSMEDADTSPLIAYSFFYPSPTGRRDIGCALIHSFTGEVLSTYRVPLIDVSSRNYKGKFETTFKTLLRMYSSQDMRRKAPLASLIDGIWYVYHDGLAEQLAAANFAFERVTTSV